MASYSYSCYFCAHKREPSPFCINCGYESPYNSERFWKYIVPGSSILELGTGLGHTALYAASQGCRVLTVDSGEDGHPIIADRLITTKIYEIYNDHFYRPSNKFDLVLVDINHETEEIINYYIQFLNPHGLMIIDTCTGYSLRKL